MKTIQYILLVAVLGLIACTEKFLDTVKIGEQTLDTFYANDKDLVSAINACYAPLWEYHYNWCRTTLGNSTTDDAVDREDLVMREYTVNSSHDLFKYNYRYNYRGILFANQLLENVEGKDIAKVKDKDLQKRVVAEAKFLRAYYYYDLVKNYGDVPLVVNPLGIDEMTKERTPAKEVYAQIEKDLKEAATDLPKKGQTEMGRATKGAAYAMLVKVAVSQASKGYEQQNFYNKDKWADAKEHAQSLFGLGGYDLYTGDYHDIFTEEGENGVGSIFEVQFYDSPLDDGAFTNNGNFTTFLNMPFLGAADPYGRYQATYDLYEEFENDDPRRDASLLNSLKFVDLWLGEDSDGIVKEDKTGFSNYKHYLSKSEYGDLGDFRNSPINERIIRLSDIYLLYAEASYHEGDEGLAREYVNKVRARARGVATVLPDVTASGENLLEAIYHERRVELCGEGHRFHDLVRTGRLEKVMKTDGHQLRAKLSGTLATGYVVEDSGDPIFEAKNLQMPKNKFFPIPQAQVDNSGGLIKQNEGY